MNFHIISIFPNMFDSYFNESILKRAQNEKHISISIFDPRSYTTNKHRKVDHKPYGGGPGMVMSAEPIILAWKDINKKIQKRFEKEKGAYQKSLEIFKKKENKLKLKLVEIKELKKDIEKKDEHKDSKNSKELLKVNKKLEKTKADLRVHKNSKSLKVIKPSKQKTLAVIFSPGGDMFTNSLAKESVQNFTDIIFVCGRYEGVDERVREVLKADRWSVGDYVLTGGELPAMTCIDVIARQVDGVLGNQTSREEERISSHEMYTRPETFVYKKKKYSVPEVLMSGDHKKIDDWRRER